jgi:hypothetical protein
MALTEKKEKKSAADAKSDETAATLRKVVDFMSANLGFSLSGDHHKTGGDVRAEQKAAKGGWSRLGVLMSVLVLAVVATFAVAESITVELLTESTYGTVKYSGDSSTTQGGFTADDLTAEDDLTVNDDATLSDGLTVGGSDVILSNLVNVASASTNGLALGQLYRTNTTVLIWY